MVFGLYSALNRVYNFRRVCPKREHLNLFYTGKVSRLSSLNMVCPKQGSKIEGDVVLTQGRYHSAFFVLSQVHTLSGTPIPKHWSSTAFPLRGGEGGTKASRL